MSERHIDCGAGFSYSGYTAYGADDVTAAKMPLAAPPELVDKNDSAPETVKITDAPPARAFTGSLLLQTEPVEFCPNAYLDRLGYPKENRPAFVLRPLCARDRHWMESDSRRMSTEGLLWAKEHGVDVTDNKNLVLLVTKFAEFSDWEKRRSIIRRSVIGFKNGAGLGGFDKCSADEGVAPELFDRFPDDLIGVIDAELTRMSGLTVEEAVGL